MSIHETCEYNCGGTGCFAPSHFSDPVPSINKEILIRQAFMGLADNLSECDLEEVFGVDLPDDVYETAEQVLIEIEAEFRSRAHLHVPDAREVPK